MGDINGWHFTAHAVDRALDMAVGADELREALTHPDYIRDSPRTQAKYKGCKIHVKGRLAVAVNPDEQAVITIMWYKQFQSGDTARRQTAMEDEEFFRDN